MTRLREPALLQALCLDRAWKAVKSMRAPHVARPVNELSNPTLQGSDKTQILELSLRAWNPVFARLKEALPGFVYDAFYPDDWRVRQAADIEKFLDQEGKNAWVVCRGERLLGWTGLRLHPADKMGEIYILAVDPAEQRRGIASALIEFAMTWMRQNGMDIVMVETGDDAGHAASRATYESAGFERWPVARYFGKL